MIAQPVGLDLPGRGGNDGAWPPLSPNVVALGLVSLLMGTSSAMIHGLLPVFLLTVLAASPAMIGAIEGISEATTSFMQVVSGRASDWIGRRKPLVIAGYALSAAAKLIFPLAGTAAAVLTARVGDRVGKGLRDAPRDALLTDVTPTGIRGTGFGLRAALYTTGAVLGPAAAIGLMSASDGNFRLVFAVALIPAVLSVAVLVLLVHEPAGQTAGPARNTAIRRADLARLPPLFWWVLLIAALLALARFSPAFLVLRAHAAGMDAALVPLVLGLIYVVYAAAAYPFGVLADRFDRRLQLAAGAAVLVAADILLANAATVAMIGLGAALWGLQMGMTQGLLSASVADAAPDSLRGTAFGLYHLATGAATFAASAGAGAVWMLGGGGAAFGAAAAVAAAAVLMLLFRPPPQPAGFPGAAPRRR